MNENKRVYIMGDFNLNLLNCSNDNDVKQLINTFHSRNLFSVITKPTRVTSTSATLLDHCWTNDILNCFENNIIFNTLSDHFPIYASFNNKTDRDEVNCESVIYFRNFNNENIQNFKLDLMNVNWQLVFVADNPNVGYDNFITIFLSLFNKNFPLIEKKIRGKSKDLPYMTSEIKHLIQDKNKLQKLAARWPLSYGDQYKRVRNEVTKIIRIAKFQYYKNKLSRCAGDTGGTWKVINEIMN